MNTSEDTFDYDLNNKVAADLDFKEPLDKLKEDYQQKRF
jgi:hypothetical protein